MLEPSQNIGRCFYHMISELTWSGIKDARSSAEVLLAKALETDRTNIFLHFDVKPDPKTFETLSHDLECRKKGMPVAYITGEKEFYSVPIKVNSTTLIPRPETECLVDEALTLCNQTYSNISRVVDVGTGSGAIAIAIKKNAPNVQMVATDLDTNALSVAAMNARMNQVHVSFQKSDLLLGVSGMFDLIVANLPYIPSWQIGGLVRDVRDFEPRVALDGGIDGLRVIQRLFRIVSFYMKRNAMLLLEFGCEQENEVTRLLVEQGFQVVKIGNDLSGKPRYALATLY